MPVRQTKIYPQARAHSRRYSVLEQEYKSRDVRSARSLFGMERSGKMATLRNTAVWTAASTVHTALPCGRAATAIHTALPCGRAATNRPHRLAREATIRLRNLRCLNLDLGRLGRLRGLRDQIVGTATLASAGDDVQRRAAQLDHLVVHIRISRLLKSSPGWATAANRVSAWPVRRHCV